MDKKQSQKIICFYKITPVLNINDKDYVNGVKVSLRKQLR